MFFFKKKSDPLTEELRRLENEQREVERQMSEIEYALQNPPEPPPANNDQPTNRGAKFPHNPLSEPVTIGGTRTRLKIQRAKTRNRIIILSLAVLFLVFVVYRCSS